MLTTATSVTSTTSSFTSLPTGPLSSAQTAPHSTAIGTISLRPSSPIDERVINAFWNVQENLATFANIGIELCQTIGVNNFPEYLNMGEISMTYLFVHYKLTRAQVLPGYLNPYYLAKLWKEKILPHLYYEGLKVPIEKLDEYYQLGSHLGKDWHLAVGAIHAQFSKLSIDEICNTWQTILESKQHSDYFKGKRIVYLHPGESDFSPHEAKGILKSFPIQNAPPPIVSASSANQPAMTVNLHAFSTYASYWGAGGYYYPGMYDYFSAGPIPTTISSEAASHQTHLTAASSSSISAHQSKPPVDSMPYATSIATSTIIEPSPKSASAASDNSSATNKTKAKILSSTRVIFSAATGKPKREQENLWLPEENEHLLTFYLSSKTTQETNGQTSSLRSIIDSYLKLPDSEKFPNRSNGAVQTQLRWLLKKIGPTDQFEFDLTGKRRENFIQKETKQISKTTPTKRRKLSKDEEEALGSDTEDEYLENSKPTRRTKKHHSANDSITSQVTPDHDNSAETPNAPSAAEATTPVRWGKDAEDHLCKHIKILKPKHSNLKKVYDAYRKLLIKHDVLPKRSCRVIGEMWRYLRDSGHPDAQIEAEQ